eukprot:1169472-Prymnesium_polylepis.1
MKTRKGVASTSAMVGALLGACVMVDAGAVTTGARSAGAGGADGAGGAGEVGSGGGDGTALGAGGDVGVGLGGCANDGGLSRGGGQCLAELADS